MLNKLKKKMAKKLKASNGKIRGMSEEEIEKLKNEIEGDDV